MLTSDHALALVPVRALSVLGTAAAGRGVGEGRMYLKVHVRTMLLVRFGLVATLRCMKGCEEFASTRAGKLAPSARESEAFQHTQWHTTPVQGHRNATPEQLTIVRLRREPPPPADTDRKAPAPYQTQQGCRAKRKPQRRNVCVVSSLAACIAPRLGGCFLAPRAVWLACVGWLTCLVRVCLCWFPPLGSDCLCMPNYCVSL